MPHLDAGDKAPEFELEDQDGKRVALAALGGGRMVLYFFPKADTSG